jgi:hypothetical protein
MIRPLAGWLPLGLLVLSSVALLWHFGHEPKDPMTRYWDDLARADRRYQRRVR